MTYKDHALRGAFIIALLLTIMGRTLGSESLTPTEQTLRAVRDCMTELPGPWSEAWQEEYIDTVHRAIISFGKSPDYALRLSIVRNGFPSNWKASMTALRMDKADA